MPFQNRLLILDGSSGYENYPQLARQHTVSLFDPATNKFDKVSIRPKSAVRENGLTPVLTKYGKAIAMLGKGYGSNSAPAPFFYHIDAK